VREEFLTCAIKSADGVNPLAPVGKAVKHPDDQLNPAFVKNAGALDDSPEHLMASREVVCADCGELLIAETRFYAVNDVLDQSPKAAPLRLTRDAVTQRSGVPPCS